MTSNSALKWFKTLFKSLPTAGKDALGERGGKDAPQIFRNQGYKIICRNFECALGEIDIIARDGRTLVFVEVKTRVDDEPTPEDQVNQFKRHQITKAAKFYLGRFGTIEPPPARFDMVAVV